MELTGHQQFLLALFRAIKMEQREQAIILALLNEEEVIVLNNWAIDYYNDSQKFPTEQEIMNKLSEILQTTRE